ncbi:prepilin peptidase [Ornithinibacillus xuwenensis]|uniref:A24 family peptidase n=1 Tax=Ornithinibacillus xuwenensis TaxID=3144668 RepID=A0ABU9XBE5_9BACI
MNTVYFILFFGLGLLFGSFFNVVGLRLPQQKSFTNDRSICPNCSHILNWYELIPIFSYIFQRGRCRHCKAKISFIYPVMELVTGFLFAHSYAQLGLSVELILALFLMSMLVIVFVSDMKYMLIPNKVLLFFLPIFIVLRVLEPLEPWWSSIIGATLGFAIIAVIIIVSNGGMGAGDMKLFGVLGIVLGIKKVLLTFFLSCVIGAVIGLLMLWINRIHRKQPIPFGPYIVVAAIVTYFYGDILINWYVSTII